MLAPAVRNRLLHKLGLHRRVHELAITSEPNPAVPERLPSFRFFAVLAAWFEADVIAATVRNVLAQGCERVYLIDNDSPDDTVAAACAAGAILAGSFRTDSYDEHRRIKIVNEVIEEVSWREASPHVWWLCLDADEFHHGPSGSTLREYLATLDRRYRVVGARVFNHFPHGRPAYVPGFHPLDFQPLCQEFLVPNCAAGHWKHPLIRVDKRGASLIAGIGFHRPLVRCFRLGRHTERCSQPTLPEPALPVFMHHFQYRNEEPTRRRLERLCGKRSDTGQARIDLTNTRLAGSGNSRRFRTLDAVYRQDWDHVDNLRRTTDQPLGVSPVPWTEAVAWEHTSYRIWYAPEDVERAQAARTPATGKADSSR
jgi:hypothetical protein